jgi:hypothetical protein
MSKVCCTFVLLWWWSWLIPPLRLRDLIRLWRTGLLPVVLSLITLRTFRVTTHYMLRKGTNIQPPIYILSLISLSVELKDNMVTMELTPSIGVIVELGPLTLPSYGTLLVGVVIHSLNTSVLRTMNLVGLRLFGPLVNIFIRHWG